MLTLAILHSQNSGCSQPIYTKLKALSFAFHWATVYVTFVVVHFENWTFHWEKKWSQNPGAVLENGATLEGGAVFSLNNHVKGGTKIVPGVELSYVPWNGSRGGAVLAPLFFSVLVEITTKPNDTRLTASEDDLYGLLWWP